MNIPSIKEVRELSTSALYGTEVDELVAEISEGVYTQANRGKRVLRYPFSEDLSTEELLINEIAFQKFKDEGYLVEEYKDHTLVKW